MCYNINMVIKIAAVIGLLAVAGFGIYFFLLRPAPAPIAQIPVPPTPEQPPAPYITPPVTPGSFFAEAPITRSLPPGFEFQKIGEGAESFETMGIVSELPTPEELTTQELEKFGFDPLLTKMLTNETLEIKWPTLEELIKMGRVELPSEPPQKMAENFVGGLIKSLMDKGLISSEVPVKDFMAAAKTEADFLEKFASSGISNEDLKIIQFSENYIDSLIKQGLLAPEEKQGALEAFKSSVNLSAGSQLNVLGPIQY